MPRGVYIRTVEYRTKMSKAMLASKTRYRFPKGHQPWNKGLSANDSEKVRESVAKGLIKYARSPEGRAYSACSLKERVTKFWDNMTKSEKTEFLKYRGSCIKQSWADSVRKKQWIQAMWEGRTRRPTKPEQGVIDVITEYSLPYKYVGTGGFLLDGKNPDFMNVNGEKKLIEVFGEYWHKGEEEQLRKDLFSRYGFKTLILWSKDIMAKSSDEIADLIIAF